MTAHRGTLLRAVLLGTVVFIVAGVLLFAVAIPLTAPTDADYAELQRTGVDPYVSRSRLAVLVCGFLASVLAGAAAGWLGSRRGMPLPLLLPAAVAAPLVLGALYALGVGVPASALVWVLLLCSGGALLGMVLLRRRGGPGSPRVV